MTRDLIALRAEIARRAQMAFAWGDRANDCVSYAAACVKAQTGRNPLRGLRWTTKRGALLMLARRGGLEAAVDSKLRSIAPAMAMRGDVAGVADPELGIALMIVEGVTLVGPSDAGEKRLPRSAMVKAWSALP